MKSITKKVGIAAASLMISASVASATTIDFTDSSLTPTATGFTGSIGATTWTLDGTPGAANFGETLGPGQTLLAQSFGLTGDVDGIGIGDDEVSAAPDFEFVTLSFSRKVAIDVFHFLDLFTDSLTGKTEVANVSLGTTAPDTVASSLSATADLNAGDNFGYGKLEDRLVGTDFTFWIDPALFASDDRIGHSDFALAAVEISAVPLPAGFLLMGTALGGLGVMRRRNRKA